MCGGGGGDSWPSFASIMSQEFSPRLPEVRCIIAIMD